MLKNKLAGFTFLEILIVLFLLGLISAVFIPNLRVRLPGYERKNSVNHINVLVQSAWQNALLTQKMHRIWFDLVHHIMRVEIQEEHDQTKFKLLTIPYNNLEYKWPENINIKNMYVEGSDILHKPGVKTETAWFYVLPDGLVQEVTLNSVDTNEIDNQGKPYPMQISINPFTANVTLQEGFTKI